MSDGEDVATLLGLSWVSDIDGEFSTQGADSTGTVVFQTNTLSVGTHAISVTVTDTDGLYATAATSVQVNGIPTAPDVSLGPDPANTTDDLVVSILTASTDADGDSMTYDYQWSVDGVATTASTTATLNASETAKGQTWTVEVTPNDGFTDGPSGTASLTIGNVAPEITSVVVTPDPATPSDSLTCAWSFYDEDGDADASTLEWTIDGAIVGTDPTLAGVFSVDDVVTCTVTANDDEDTGTSASASVTIANTPPAVTDVVLSPSEVFTNDTVTATVTTEDAEGDSVAVDYAWYVDGSLVAETSNSLDGATYFDKGQEVYVVVTPDDGWESGSSVTSDSLTVSNTPPTAPELAFDPTEPEAGVDDLLCWVDVDADDDDGDAIGYTFEWAVNGSSWTGSTATTAESGDTISGADTAGDDSWTCTVTPNDGDDDGPSASVSVMVRSCDEDGDGYDSDATGCGGDDCNDLDGAIYPGSGCDWVIHLYAPGSTTAYVVSEADNEITVSGSATASLTMGAGDGYASLSLNGDTTFRGTQPFLVLMTTSGSGGDQVAKGRASNGDLLSTEIFTWSGGYLSVQNPGSSSASLTVDSWNGSAWSSYSTGTAAAGSSTSFGAAWGLYRITSTEPVSAFGLHHGNIENHYEYAVATDGLLVGEEYLWSIPSVSGKVGLSGLCIDSSGCSVSTSTSSGTVSSHTLSLGDNWTDYVSSNTDYWVQSTGLITLRDEATPYGYTVGDGSTMDTDLVPGTTGVEYDTEFVFNTCVGPSAGMSDRLSDVILIGYSDGTSVTIEELDSTGSWTTWDTLTLETAVRCWNGGPTWIRIRCCESPATKRFMCS